MKKLKSMTKDQLLEKYWLEFGSCGENISTRRLIAAIFYGKQATYLTEEELNSLEEH
jgi:hypothetical protein